MQPGQIASLIEASNSKRIMALVGGTQPPVSSYSLSRVMWDAAFAYFDIDAEYIPLDVHCDLLEETLDMLLSYEQIVGLNITSPHKEGTAQHRLVTIGALERIIGINTVVRTEDETNGYSTDGSGVRLALEEAGVELKDKSIVILGAGGAAASIALELAKYGNVTVANRTLEKAQALEQRATSQFDKIRLTAIPLYQEDEERYSSQLLRALREADVVINTIPIERTGQRLLRGYELASGRKTCMDIVYGHKSLFLNVARKQGHKAIDGRAMLLHQAVQGFYLAFGACCRNKDLDPEEVIAPMRYALKHFRHDTPYEQIIAEVQGKKQQILRDYSAP